MIFATNRCLGGVLLFLLYHLELKKVEGLCTVSYVNLGIPCVVKALCDSRFGSNVEYNQCTQYSNSYEIEMYLHVEPHNEIQGYYYFNRITKMILTTGYLAHSIPTLPNEMDNLKKLTVTHSTLTVAKLWNKFQLRSLRELDYSNNSINTIEQEMETPGSPSNYRNFYHPRDSYVFDTLVKLNLSHNEITNLTKNNFKHLQILEILDLSYNKIQFIELLVFTYLEQLEEINLTANKINDLTFLLSITSKLQKLYLGQNEIKVVDKNNFKQIKNLKVLDLQLNFITILDENIFTFMPFIEILNLNKNEIQNIKKTTFLKLSNLQILYLSDNRLERLEPNLFQDKNMSTFIFKGNNLEGALEANMCSGLKSVTELDFSFQHIDEINDFAFLGCDELSSLMLNNNNLHRVQKNAFKGLEKLISLDLSENALTEIDFDTDSLSNLVVLSIKNNNINHISNISFSGLLFVEHLDLSGNNITSITPNLFMQMHSLTDLKLENNPVFGSLLGNTFTGLDSLPELNLAHTFLQSICNNSFDGLNSLRELNLSHSNISHIEFNAFYGLKNQLEVLDISFNKINEFQINTDTLVNLRSLFLNNNNIMALEIKTFKLLKDLHTVDVSHNKLHSIKPGTLKALESLYNLDLSYNFNLSLINSLADYLPLNISNLDLSATQADIDFDTFNKNIISSIHLARCNISSNKLERLKLKFLTELEDICLSRNVISEVKVAMFENANLRVLDLSVNKIDFIQPGSFNFTPRLLHLNLSHNELIGLTYGIFKNLASLINLDLSYNKIETLKSEMFYQLESLSTLIVDHNRISYLEPNEFDGTKLKSLSIGGNALPCETIIELQNHRTLRVAALNLDHTSESIDGITCNVNVNMEMDPPIYSNYTISNNILKEIRDLLLNRSRFNKPSKEYNQEVDLKQLLYNVSTDLKIMFDSQNKISHESQLNASSLQTAYGSSLIGINRTNLLLEKIIQNPPMLPVMNTTNRLLDKNIDFNIIPHSTENTKIENNENHIIIKDNNYEKNISELEQKISYLITRFNSLSNQIMDKDKSQKMEPAVHDKLTRNSEKESMDSSKSSVFIETCVGLILFGMIFNALFKMYKKRTVRSRRTASTCEMTGSMENSNL